MTTYVGGIRERLVSDSVFHTIKAALADLGWFDSGRDHQPIDFRTDPYPRDKEIPWNSLILASTHTTDDDAELGSNFGEVRTTHYVDFYAEDDSIGKHVVTDIKDILKGRMPLIGRNQANIPVRDWTMATPPIIFYCDVEDVVTDKALDFPKPWHAFWWTCRFDIVDWYGGED